MIKFITPDNVFLLAICLGAVSLYLSWKFQSRKFFFYYRLILVALLVLAFLEPAYIKLSKDSKPMLAVAVDTSNSMSITGRFKTAVDFLKKNKDVLEKRFKIKFYMFSGSASEIEDVGRTKNIRYGASTDISGSLWEIKRENSEKLDGIVLLSDGQHNSGPLSKTWIEELNIPVFPVVPGKDSQIKDVSITSVQVGDFAFKKIPLKISVEINVTGYKSKIVVIKIRQKEMKDAAAQQSFVVESDNEARVVPIEITPQQSGKLSLTIEAVPLPGEVTKNNNYKQIDVDVVLEKIRVLYLCGQPGYEYSFLRNNLKNDPLVELVSFVILRNNLNITLVSDEDLSLIPFPVNDIFSRDIYDYDILILENFTYKGYGFYPDHFENINKWTAKNGGGLLVIGGENSFYEGGWKGTAIERLLPVEFDKDTRTEEGMFKVYPENTTHEILRLSENPEENKKLLKDLPELDNCQQLRPKKEATVLLKHPYNWAVLTCWDFGKGRVVVTGTNTTWRWSLGGVSPEIYNTFWRNVIRYLSKANGPGKANINFDKVTYFAGSEFSMKVKLTSKQPPEIVMKDPRGNRNNLTVLRKGTDEYHTAGKFSFQGKYMFEIFSAGKKPVASQAVEVLPSHIREELNLNINEKLLQEISSRSNGEIMTSEEFQIEKIIGKIKKNKNNETAEKLPLAHSSAALFIVIAGFIFEWVLRKRRGLL